MREPFIAEGAIFAPGTCMCCGSNEGEMVDTCVDIPGDGRMYLCVRTCVPLIANLLGYKSPGQVKKIEALLATAREALQELDAKWAQAEPIITAIREVVEAEHGVQV